MLKCEVVVNGWNEISKRQLTDMAVSAGLEIEHIDSPSVLRFSAIIKGTIEDMMKFRNENWGPLAFGPERGC